MRISTSEVTIGAPRETVWAVLTEPEHVKNWQYGSVLETDWTVGSPIRFSVEWDGTSFEQWGDVLLVDEPRELRYSLFAPRPGVQDSPETRFTMVYQLTDVPAGTHVTITQEDPRSGPAEAGDEEEANPILAALRSVAEALVR